MIVCAIYLDRSNEMVNARYEDALADLAAFENIMESLGGEMTTYIDSINGEMWRDLDPADSWVSPMSMMQTREPAWHARKMTQIKDLVDEYGYIRSSINRDGSMSVEDIETESRVMKMREAQGMEGTPTGPTTICPTLARSVSLRQKSKDTVETYSWSE